jgi:hypothetical protein
MMSAIRGCSFALAAVNRTVGYGAAGCISALIAGQRSKALARDW